MFTVFVETQSGAGLDLDADGVGQTTQQASASEVKLGAGAIVDLAKNEKVQFANPGRPNSSAEAFIGAMLREIGTALELPYEVLMKAFESSYSAARAALLEAWRFFRARRAWLAMMFCQPVYEAWLEEAVARGRVDAPGFFDDPAMRAAYAGAEWIGDGPGQIDPLKEVQAATARIAGNLSNHTLETLEMRGMDWAEVHEQLQAERALIGPTASKPAAPADDDPDKMDAEEMEEGMRNGQ
jgi:lambda family phage portal protein